MRPARSLCGGDHATVLMTISTTRHSIEEDQCDRESSGHTPCHTLPAQKAKKISATERAVATLHATHSPHRRSRRRQSPTLLAMSPSTTAVYMRQLLLRRKKRRKAAARRDCSKKETTPRSQHQQCPPAKPKQLRSLRRDQSSPHVMQHGRAARRGHKFTDCPS
jgi:hypothetical protein